MLGRVLQKQNSEPEDEEVTFENMARELKGCFDRHQVVAEDALDPEAALYWVKVFLSEIKKRKGSWGDGLAPPAVLCQDKICNHP